MASTTSASYTRVAIILHWLIAIMIIGQIVGGKVMMAIAPSQMKFELFQLHKSFGFIILGLSVIRLVWRMTHKAPPLPDGMASWERLGAHMSHYGFYILMIGTPVAGWLMVSSATPRITTKIFKLIQVPHLPVPQSKSLEGAMETTHEYMAYAIIALLLLHIGAALKHHLVEKDDVLTRMIPMLKRKD